MLVLLGFTVSIKTDCDLYQHYKYDLYYNVVNLEFNIVPVTGLRSAFLTQGQRWRGNVTI